MRTPTIHLNGTSKQALCEQVRDAAHALRDALKMLENAGPHGRDYYPQGPGALDEAIKEHRSRLERIQSVMEELQAIHEAIMRRTS